MVLLYTVGLRDHNPAHSDNGRSDAVIDVGGGGDHWRCRHRRGFRVGCSPEPARAERQRIEQVKYEEDRIKDLEAIERARAVRSESLSPAEQEELRQLRERAVKRKIEGH
jgi:hypothetical protein